MENQHPPLTGLTEEEVIASRKAHGANILTPPEKDPLWKQYLEKFNDPLIIILLIAGALSICISIYEYFATDKGGAVFFEPVGIFIAILLATGLAFIFELKANKEFSLLNQVNDDEAVRVIRSGNVTEVPRKDVVVGDIVLLAAGEEIPADAELLEAVSMNVDESSLTGEPMCRKSHDPAQFSKEATFPTNHVMRGTKVMEGHGKCRVLAVGDKTESGKVFVAAQIDDSVKTPLNEQLDGLGDLITKASYAFAALIIVGRLIMYFSGSAPFQWVGFISYLLQTLMIAVTLVVVAVPEGLPMAVTLSLAYSMRRMLKTNNLVRKMHACETMGATTVICTDKTGTLTQNRMSVRTAVFPSLGATPTLADNDASVLVKEAMACNSTAELDLADPNKPSAIGNPTEGALLLWLREQGIDYKAVQAAAQRTGEIPFSTLRKYMASTVRSANGQHVLHVKGAPEIVLAMCSHVENLDAINTQLREFQNQAMRTLGFAYKILGEDEKAIDDEGNLAASGLQFLGVTAIADPVRDDVPAAVTECTRAGIDIKIVTGDTPNTAKEIGRQINLWDNAKDGDANLITGPELAALSDEELAARAQQFKIIARARPMDKERLVRALQSKNEVVAVTGDGTNDAPALNAAHVGLSMGDGTAVAKEASDITIVDNSFTSIGKAVMWGRSLYLNIQRFILFQLTVNVAAYFTVLFGAFMGTESPLTVTQMLWVNLIMDTFAAMALASLPPSSAVMRDAPRDRNAFIISPAMRNRIIWVGGLFFALLIGLVWKFERNSITSMSGLLSAKINGARDGLQPYELSMFFTIFVMLQFWNMFNARAFATGKSALHFSGCGGFIVIACIIFLGQILIINIGGEFFNVTPLKLADWIAITVLTSLVLWIGEAARWRRGKNTAAAEGAPAETAQ